VRGDISGARPLSPPPPLGGAVLPEMALEANKGQNEAAALGAGGKRSGATGSGGGGNERV
jgi:hypothetical protein